uniref:Uncharacterized protein n=1 Tax=Panagrolaimus sp. PS1159 TaxID=55785 RepID=A0AC35G1W7_9BILA
MKDCSSCVMYGCKSGVTNYGCPEDFFTECATHTNIVSFIKRHNYNDLEYVQNFGVTYISCGTCSSGDLGMKPLTSRATVKSSSSPITTKPPVLDTDTSKPPPPPDATNEPQPSASTPAPSNVSNNQNSALKFIGILAFGWITADWIF